jgi:hypothetical protein
MQSTNSLLASLTEAPAHKDNRKKPYSDGVVTADVMISVQKFGRGQSKRLPDIKYTKRTWHRHYSALKVSTRGTHFEGLDESGNPIWS